MKSGSHRQSNLSCHDSVITYTAGEAMPVSVGADSVLEVLSVL